MLLILGNRLQLPNVAQRYSLIMPLVYLGFQHTTVPCSSKFPRVTEDFARGSKEKAQSGCSRRDS